MNARSVLITLLAISVVAIGMRLAFGPPSRKDVEESFETRDFPEGVALLQKSFLAPRDLAWGPIKEQPVTTEVNFVGPFNKTVGVQLYREAQANGLTYTVRTGYSNVRHTEIEVRGPKNSEAKTEEDALRILKIDPALAAAFGKTASAKFLGENYYLEAFNSNGPEINCSIYKAR